MSEQAVGSKSPADRAFTFTWGDKSHFQARAIRANREREPSAKAWLKARAKREALSK